MVKVKEMPYSEKYAKVIDNMKFDETFILPFVQKHLGDQAGAEIRKTWQEGMKPIPSGGSFEEKYEVAYANWIWLAKNIYPFIRKRMGEDGLKKFERAEVEGLIKKNANPALFMLKIIRAFSSGTAFGMTAKQMAYQLQWLTPYSVPELTHTKAVLDIPRCKILDFPDTEDICFVGCQSTYPKWVAEQFKVEMKFNRQGNSCTSTLAPLK
ncbi:MAG: hypothetical protein Q7V12_09710 [Deltaproteobacteria bacterium]|jgi:hypothetical protein|nr:hypothetical protein [Deltaproteobacteria bacterium]MDO9351471.1 hypothetical protein [Deltaproteobacteria bacterium]